jgi:integrase/recombinase XerD
MNNPIAVPSASFLARPGTGEYLNVSRVEVLSMIAHARTEQTRLLIRTLWNTGARISEVLAIQVKDVDQAKQVIYMRRLKRRKPFVQTVPVPADLINTLMLYARTKRRRGRIFMAHRVSAYVSIRKVSERALGRKIGPKWFRHGRTYSLMKGGVHPLIGSRALGHASPVNIMSYNHPTLDDLRAALEFEAI